MHTWASQVALVVKNPLADPGSILVRKIPQRRKWHPTPVFLPGKFNSVGRGAWWATVHVATKSWTQLSEHRQGHQENRATSRDRPVQALISSDSWVHC